jgi:multidrug efflux pump subunit AcrA (membrane-fusion protein)
LFVRLRFPGGPSYGSLLVPQESIITDQGQKYVFVVGAENKVEYRRVKTGALQEDGWLAVTGDLKTGESVVVEGMIKTRPGEVVRPQPWASGEVEASPTPAATPESSAP